MIAVNIKKIPHNQQRYETPGDWWFRDSVESGEKILEIRVSDLGNEDWEQCIAFHEYFEALVATKNGISEKEICAFDIKYEEEREACLHSPDDEPGMDKNAPYRKEHQFATGVELILASCLGVVWEDYNKKVVSLSKDK